MAVKDLLDYRAKKREPPVVVEKPMTLEVYRGLKGDMGPQGAVGPPGRDGRDGVDGTTGLAGKDGREGLRGVDGKNGKDGKDADLLLIAKIQSQLDALALEDKTEAETKKKEFHFTVNRDRNGLIKDITAKEI